MRENVDKNMLSQLIKNEINGDEDFFNRLFELWVKECNELKSHKVDNQLNSEQLNSLSKLAHKLKTSCRSFGAVQLSEGLQRLEIAAKNNNIKMVLQLNNEVIKSTELAIEQVRQISKTIFIEVKKSA